MVKIWTRILYLNFINDDTGESLVLGKTVDDSQKPKIEITGTKYMSSVKDNFKIQVYNLTYIQMYMISKRQLYHVEIYAGYLNGQNYFNFTAPKIYDGYMINMLNTKKDYKDNVTTFIITSKLVAKAQQWRMNVSYQSGVNLYSMMKYIGEKAGLTNMNISESFKDTFMNDVASCDTSASSYLEKISETSNDCFMTTDSTSDSEISIFTLSDEDRSRTTISIDPSKGMMIDTPEINSSGLTFSSLPVLNYLIGDTIKIDNSYINTSEGQDNYSGSTKVPNAVYLNAQGLYYIWQVDYTLSNTNGDFKIQLTCKNKEMFDNLTNS